METKTYKNKIKRIPKLIKHINSLSEQIVVEVPNDTKEEAAIIKSENDGILIEKIEKQDVFIDSPKNTHRKFSKIYFINILKNKKRLFITLIPWVLLIILSVVLFYSWSQLSDKERDAISIIQNENIDIINDVGEIMVLPSDEIPQIATLKDTDIIKIKSQPFFINAKIGDKLIVYSVARKVILYSPELNKIVEVANLDGAIGN